MSSFTGVSVVTGRDQFTTTAVNAGTDSGYHLLVVKDYSRAVQEIPNGQSIRAGPFVVGGLPWYIWYYPNGYNLSSAHFISFYIGVWDDDDEAEDAMQAKFDFSFVDDVEYQKPMYIRGTETWSLSNKGHLYGRHDFVRRDGLEQSVHLKDDCFTIRCDIMVCKDANTGDAIGTLSDLHQHFDHLLQNKVGADVTFEVNGETFAAHRCVLAARSKVFMAQLFGPMTESTASTVIQIQDMQAKVFADLLNFIYTDSFPVHDEEKIQDEEEAVVFEQEGQEDEAAEPVVWLQWLQDLFVAADRYDIQQLKFSCEKKLSEHIGVRSLACTLALAEKHHSHGLKEACLNFIQVQSLPCLQKVMDTDGWEHLATTYPSVVKEIIAKLASSQKNDNKRKR